jgi:hypothetical protein
VNDLGFAFRQAIALRLRIRRVTQVNGEVIFGEQARVLSGKNRQIAEAAKRYDLERDGRLFLRLRRQRPAANGTTNGSRAGTEQNCPPR